MNITEEILQSQCVEWFHNNRQSQRKMLHCNNNNSHNRIAGNRNKIMGVVAGVSDLELIGKNCVVFIELKTDKGTQSDEQKKFQSMVEERGHRYEIIRTLEDFKKLVDEIIKL